MINELTSLALSVSSNIPTEEVEESFPTMQIVLIAAACVVAAAVICLIAFRKKIKAASEAKKLKKAENARQAELDRLHRIKKQNKRK